MSELIVIIWLICLSTYLMTLCIDNMYKEDLLPRMNKFETVVTILFGFLFSPLYLVAAVWNKARGEK